MEFKFKFKCKYIILILMIGIINSCNLKEKGKIPGYIRINEAKLKVKLNEGSNTHKIVDVWVNVDGKLQGVYELPVTFPLIETGKRKITLRAGIKVNGISKNRQKYPFYKMIIIDTTIIEDFILTFYPEFEYKEDVVFKWIEDFSYNGHSLEKMPESDTLLYIQRDSSNNYFGKFMIDNTRKNFFYKSSEEFELPKDGTPVYLELDYKCNHPFIVGVIANNIMNSITIPYLVINPHPNKYNHIYIYLTDVILKNTNAKSFNIFIRSSLQDGYNVGEFEIDNIKLLHF